MATIKVKDIRKVFDKIISKLEYEGVDKVEIETDFYRFIPADEWGNYDKDIIAVGSLDDDIESLLKIVNDDNRICTYVDFDRMASLLHAISEKLNPPYNE